MLEDFTIFHTKVLALCAWADGEFDIDEERLYIAIIESSTPSEKLKIELFGYIDEAPDFDEVLQEIPSLPKRTVVVALKNAYLISMATHDLCDQEKLVIESIAKQLSVTDDQIPKVYEMLAKYYDSCQIEEELFYD